jgi:hypothetical protein
MKRLLQDAECKKQGFAPKLSQMTFKKVAPFFEVQTLKGNLLENQKCLKKA